MTEKGNLDKLIEKADEALKHNNFEYALQILQQLLKMDPNSEMGNTLFFSAVQKKWQKIGKMPKPGSKMAMFKIKLDVAFKKWGIIIDKMRDLHIEDPLNTKVLELLSEALMWERHYYAVMITCKKLVSIDQKHLLGWFWLAKAQKELDLIDDSMVSVTKAMELDNHNKDITDFYRDLSAKQTMEKKNLAGAKSFIDVVDKDEVKRAIQKDKKLTQEELITNIAELGDIDSCKNYKEAIQIGEYYGELADYANAVKAFKKAYELNKSYIEALDKAGDYGIKHYHKKIRECKEKDNKEKEEEFTQKLLEFQIQEFQRRAHLRPTDLEIRFNLGTYLYQAKNYKDAVRELQHAKKDLKRRNDCEIMLGRCFLELDSFDLALRTLTELIKAGELKDERKKEALYWTGHTYFRKGDKKKAKEYWMDVQSIDYDYKDVAELIEKCNQ